MATLDPMVWGDAAKLETAPAVPQATPQEQSPFSLQTEDESPTETPLDPMIWGDTAGENQPLDPNVWGVSAEGAAAPSTAPKIAPKGELSELPTPETPGEYLRDWAARTRTIARGGTEAFLEGVESLVPGTEKSVWKLPSSEEGWREPLARYTRPLGIIGGPVDVLLSPASAVVSQAGRAMSDLERKLIPGREPIAYEEWAPLATALAAGGIGPARKGLLKIALGPGRALKATPESIASAAQQGIRSTEGALQRLAAEGSEAAGELAQAPRTAQREWGRFFAETTGPRWSKKAGEAGKRTLTEEGLAARLSKLTPEEAEDFTRAVDPYRYLERIPESQLAPGEKASLQFYNSRTKQWVDKAAGTESKYRTKLEMTDPTTGQTVTSFGPERAVQWHAPTTQAVKELMPEYRRVFHGTRGVIPRAFEQYENPMIVGAGPRGGKRVRPFGPRRGPFFPREYTPEQVTAITEKGRAQALAAGKQVQLEPDIIAGEQKIWLSRAQHARTSDINDYIRNPYEAVMSRANNVGKVMGRTIAFGPKGEKLVSREGMLNRLMADFGPKVRMDIEEALKRDLTLGHAPNAVADTMRSFEAMTKMSLSFISNATQSAVTALVAGVGNTAKAVGQTVAHAIKDRRINQMADELGLLNKASMQAIHREIAGAAPGKLAKVTEKVLLPFELVEGGLNQNIAARAGLNRMREINTRLEKSGTLRGWEKAWLKRAGLDVSDILERGKLSQIDMRNGAWAIVDQTQMLARPTAMPNIMRANATMRVLFQMKTFAARMSRTIIEEVFKEGIERGNWRPLARMVAVFPIAGEGARRAQSFARGRELKEIDWEDPKALLQRAVENSLYVGGIGIVTDLARSAALGKEALLSAAIGPAATSVAELTTGAVRLGQHRFGGPQEKRKYETAMKYMGRQITKRIPVVGPMLAEQQKTQQQRRQSRKY